MPRASPEDPSWFSGHHLRVAVRSSRSGPLRHESRPDQRVLPSPGQRCDQHGAPRRRPPPRDRPRASGGRSRLPVSATTVACPSYASGRPASPATARFTSACRTDASTRRSTTSGPTSCTLPRPSRSARGGCGPPDGWACPPWPSTRPTCRLRAPVRRPGRRSRRRLRGGPAPAGRPHPGAVAASHDQLSALGVDDLHRWGRGVDLDLFGPSRRNGALHDRGPALRPRAGRGPSLATSGGWPRRRACAGWWRCPGSPGCGWWSSATVRSWVAAVAPPGRGVHRHAAGRGARAGLRVAGRVRAPGRGGDVLPDRPGGAGQRRTRGGSRVRRSARPRRARCHRACSTTPPIPRRCAAPSRRSSVTPCCVVRWPGRPSRPCGAAPGSAWSTSSSGSTTPPRRTGREPACPPTGRVTGVGWEAGSRQRDGGRRRGGRGRRRRILGGRRLLAAQAGVARAAIGKPHGERATGWTGPTNAPVGDR